MTSDPESENQQRRSTNSIHNCMITLAQAIHRMHGLPANSAAQKQPSDFLGGIPDCFTHSKQAGNMLGKQPCSTGPGDGH